MQRRLERIYSSNLGRPIHVWIYGHWGSPVLAFPTAGGYAHEWEQKGMVEALAPLIEGGRIKLYCVETNVAETLTQKHTDPRWRIMAHRAYERFVYSELVPGVRTDCRTPDLRLAAVGASLGALYAANCALQQPEIFNWALCLSGRYELTHFFGHSLGGDYDLEVYFSNPLAYVANLEGDALERVRSQTRVHLVCGQGRFEEGCIEETHRLADVLHVKGIPHERDIWGHDVSHEWPWWHRQALYPLGRTFG